MAEQKFKHVSVGKDGSVWAVVQNDGTIFRLYGDASIVGWVPEKVGKVEVIAAFDSGNAWCVNKRQEIWHVTNGANPDKGGTWTQFPTHSGRPDASTISVGNDGSVWYVQTDGALFHTASFGDSTEVQFWVQDTIGNAEVIAVVDATSLYCINKEREIWYGQNGTWSQIPTYSGRSDANSIAVSPDGYAWYSTIDGVVLRHVWPGEGIGLSLWAISWDQQQMGRADVLAVGPQDLVWCLNTQSELWRALDDMWQPLAETDPREKMWTYEIKQGDGLIAIVQKEFKLKDPKDAQEVGHLVDLIVAQNGIKNPDSIKPGDRLTLHY